MRATLYDIIYHTPDIATFLFVPEEPVVHYVPGQFIELTLSYNPPAGHTNRRWFTLSSSPTEPFLAITTHLDSERNSAFKAHLAKLQAGDPVTISQPMGDFVLPIQPSIPLLFVAGGVGITPVRSMVKWLADRGQQRPVQVVHTVREPEELLFQDVFTTYGVRPDYILPRSHPSWPGKTGRLSAQSILKEYAPQGLLYISGPELMTERLVAEFREVNFPSHRLITDYFPGYSAF